MIRLENIKKVYNAGTVDAMCLFDGLDLTVNDGDFISVVGSNGSGKTSLLNIICGNVAVDGGKDYLRRCGALDAWEELSRWSEE